MGKTASPPRAERDDIAEVVPVSTARPQTVGQLLYAGLQTVASLRLTVVLFVLAILLVFFGTLAQKDAGIWTAVETYFRSAVVWVPFQIFVRFAQVFFNLPPETDLPGGFPFPGGWLLGGLLLANLLAAHAIRFKLTWKRTGIILLHAGIIVMMLGEFVTGKFAIEGNMVIEEGEASNYLIHNRFSELAVIDSSDPKTDDVVAVPENILRQGGVLRHEMLPFDMEVLKYMVNSDLARVGEEPAGVKNRATAGFGLTSVAVERPEVSGVDQNQRVDAPSAYLTLKRKADGQSLGTYLFSVLLGDEPQQVKVDGKTYDVLLRFKRSYKPYTLHLLKFTFDRYPGTDKAKDYASEVRLVDPEYNEERVVLIRMNEPLRYRGETFFQADFNKRTEKGTVLQVVRNPGWLMPYIACGMVSLGMLVHFGIGLTNFLGRRAAA